MTKWWHASCRLRSVQERARAGTLLINSIQQLRGAEELTTEQREDLEELIEECMPETMRGVGQGQGGGPRARKRTRLDPENLDPNAVDEEGLPQPKKPAERWDNLFTKKDAEVAKRPPGILKGKDAGRGKLFDD